MAGKLTIQRAEDAIVELAESDEKYAILKADLARAEYALHLARKVGFFASEAPTVRARELEAEATPLMQDRQQKYADKLLELTKLETRRKTLVIIVDAVRTVEASRRVGNLT